MAAMDEWPCDIIIPCVHDHSISHTLKYSMAKSNANHIALKMIRITPILTLGHRHSGSVGYACTCIYPF